MPGKKEHPIGSKDRGHAHTGGVMNHGKANHQHGKKKVGRSKSPSKGHHAGGPHPVMGKKKGY